MVILRVKRLSQNKEQKNKGSKQKQSANNDVPPTVAIDTREKKPYVFKKEKSIIKTLKYGDYQIDGFPELIVIERKKSIDELCSNIGVNRKRFERLLKKMLKSKYRYIIVEDQFASIEYPEFSKMVPSSIYSTIASYEIKYGIHFIFASNRFCAFKIARLLLLRAWKEYCNG